MYTAYFYWIEYGITKTLRKSILSVHSNLTFRFFSEDKCELIWRYILFSSSSSSHLCSLGPADVPPPACTGAQVWELQWYSGRLGARQQERQPGTFRWLRSGQVRATLEKLLRLRITDKHQHTEPQRRAQLKYFFHFRERSLSKNVHWSGVRLLL